MVTPVRRGERMKNISKQNFLSSKHFFEDLEKSSSKSYNKPTSLRYGGKCQGLKQENCILKQIMIKKKKNMLALFDI